MDLRVISFLAWILITGSVVLADCDDITCESTSYKPHTCLVDGIIQSVTISEQISKRTCLENDSYSYAGNEIHVSKGCRAKFKVCFDIGTDTPTTTVEQFLSYSNTEANQNTTEIAKSKSNNAAYVSLVALVVMIAITVAVVCIKRRGHAKNVRNGVSSEITTINKQPKHREVANLSCNDYKVKSATYSYCSTSRTSTHFNSGYVDIERDGCDNKQHKYSHLTIQTLPYFDNTYSHLKANQNNICWISDITYSHLDNENSPTETTEDIDVTYNRLQVNTSNGMKRFQEDPACDTDYSHLDARAQNTEIDADDYSHLNYKSPGKNKEHSSSDWSGNTHELAIVETSDGEIRHEYFVLEKIS